MENKYVKAAIIINEYWSKKNKLQSELDEFRKMVKYVRKSGRVLVSDSTYDELSWIEKSIVRKLESLDIKTLNTYKDITKGVIFEENSDRALLYKDNDVTMTFLKDGKLFCCISHPSIDWSVYIKGDGNVSVSVIPRL